MYFFSWYLSPMTGKWTVIDALTMREISAGYDTESEAKEVWRFIEFDTTEETHARILSF